MARMGCLNHGKLQNVLCQKRLLDGLENMAEQQINTTMLEVFHVLKIAYLPKRTFFEIDKLIASTQIATLDHNQYVNREQVQANNIFFAPEFLLSIST